MRKYELFNAKKKGNVNKHNAKWLNPKKVKNTVGYTEDLAQEYLESMLYDTLK